MNNFILGVSQNLSQDIDHKGAPVSLIHLAIFY